MELEKLKKERAKHCLEKKEQIEKLKQVIIYKFISNNIYFNFYNIKSHWKQLRL